MATLWTPIRPVSLLSAGCLVLLSQACAQRVASPPEVAELATSPYEEELPELEGESGPLIARESPRKVGDLWVHRFSGNYRASDLILREEVVGEEGDLLMVDFTLTEGESDTQLRVHMAKRSERVIKVFQVIDGKVIPGSLADFDGLMEKTSFVPDQNHGKIASKSQTCLVGKAELNCELSEYKVFLGEKEATLTVAHNDELRRDISGEITAVDGTVLYHAELLEMQRGKGSDGRSDGVALVSKDIDFDVRE